MHYTLKEQHLRRLCEINNFQVPTDQMIFFGIRSSVPIDASNHDFAAEHEIESIDINYINPRCTLIQWRPAKGDFAVFPGSTVPNRSYVKGGIGTGGAGVNQLVTGYFDDYRKGPHKAGKPGGHEAFRQTKAHPVRRTGDDYDYANDDRVEFTNPYDNIHAAFCQGVNSDNYSSAGCQVVVGFPKSKNYSANIGPWKSFHGNAYKLAQTSFPYVLLTGRDALQAVNSAAGTIPARVRFGSDGPLVEKVQNALKKEGFYEGIIDGDLGKRTVRAVLDYQTAVFGPDEDDGIVGKVTAAALKITGWPSV